MKASAFRRWPVAGAYSPEQTTRLTGGSDSIGMDYSNLKPLYSFDFYLHSTKFIIEMNANHCKMHSFLVYFIYT